MVRRPVLLADKVDYEKGGRTSADGMPFCGNKKEGGL